MASCHLPVIIALAAASAIGTAGWGDLYNETDGQYGGAAKVMARSGSWLIPENDGIPRLVKPPLLYWAIAASMKIFGVHEFAARFPNALAVTAWVVITFLFGAHWAGKKRGFLAGLILLTSLGTFTLGRIVMPEPLFSAFIAGSLYCALRGADLSAHSRQWYLGFWLFASLASFTKGWHGLLYPLAIVGVAAILCRPARERLRGLLSWQGTLLFAMINLPWYIYVEVRFPGYLYNLLISEQLGHIVGLSTPATSYTDVPRWQFLLLQLAWLFPWSLGTYQRSSPSCESLPPAYPPQLSGSDYRGVDRPDRWVGVAHRTAARLLRHVDVAGLCLGCRLGFCNALAFRD